MHRPTISEIEASRRRVTSDELARFARTYEVSIAWLTGCDDTDDEIDDRVKLAARELAKLKPTDLATRAVRAACRVRANLGIGPADAVCPFDIAERLMRVKPWGFP